MAPLSAGRAESGQETDKAMMDDKSLFFINRYSKDPPGRRHAASRIAISKHVQYVIRKKKKHDAMLSLNSRRHNRKGFTWQTTKAKGVVLTDSVTQTALSFSCPAAPNPSCSDAAKTHLRPNKHFEAQSDLQLSWGTEMQALWYSGFTNHAPLSDILTSMPQPQAIVATNALAFYMLTFLPRVYPVPSQARAHKQWIMQRLVTSPVLYFSMLASGAAGVQALPGGSHWKRLITPANAKWLEMTAVGHLRSSLASSEVLDPSLLIHSVMCLVVAQIVNGDMNAIQAHASALSHLIQLHQALKGMPMNVVEGFISSCYISSMITGQPPLPPPFYPTEMTRAEAHHVLLQIIDSHPHLADLGQAFFDSSIEAALGPKYTQLLLDMRAVVIWREHHYGKEQQCSDAEIKYFHNLSRNTRFLALNLQCAAGAEAEESMPSRATTDLSLHPDYTPANRRQSIQGALQEPCRIALLIFWNAYNQVSRPGSLLYRTLATQLERALKTALKKSALLGFSQLWRLIDKQAESVLLWIMLLGALMTQGIDDESERFFLRSIADYLRTSPSKDSMRTWPEARDILKRGLYLDRVFGQSMERCWMQAGKLAG